MHLTVEREEIATIVLRFTDSIENEDFDNSDMLAQKRIDNFYRSDYEIGSMLDLLALDYEGNVVGRLTAEEFFGERLGF